MTIEKKVAAAGTYRVGDAVRHARLGLGEVVAVGDGRVVVRFKGGEKTLVLGIAPLTKVGHVASASVYGASPIKRERRTRAELEALDFALALIVGEIEPATVRQVFYQAVVRGLVPKDEARGYKLVQRRLVKLRECGEIPYGWITDNVRLVRGYSRYNGPNDYAQVAAEFYRRDYWAESTVNVEVWLEKDALAGVLTPTVVEECGLNLHVTRGYASVSYLQSAADHIRRDGRPTYVYLLTDFDPSGLGISDTVAAELVRRSHPVEVIVERLAVDRAQIDEWNLPTRPTKATDSRAAKFTREHGTGSVELDAIPPATLRGLVRGSIERHMDPDALRMMKLAEHQERDVLRSVWGGAA